MKKRISVFLISILLCLACAFPVWAGTVSRLDDQAGLLDAEQQESLSSTLDEISERDQVDVVVVTVNSLEGKTAQAYAEDYFIDHGYGQGENGDGILFLLDMGDRNWAIATHGYAIEVFTDAGQSYIMDQVKPYLSDGDYNEAFQKFATECDDFITQADEAEPYDVENLPDEPFAVGNKPADRSCCGACGRITGDRKYEKKAENCAKTGSGGFLCAAGQYGGDQK